MELADVIIGAAQDQDLRMRQGVVTQASPLLVRVGSAATAVTCRSLSSYLPFVGDAVTVLVVEGDRIVIGNVGASRPARGVLARGLYGAADQALTVAGGQVALSGSPINTTVAANRYTRLSVKLAFVPPGAGAILQVVHYWNGVAQFFDQIYCQTGVSQVFLFSTPPLGLPALTANYAVTVQAFGAPVTIQHNSFQTTNLWVEDLGAA